ncbi:MAG TPA: efflux RND transporter periplasmic adaptor subunit, partial [Candidatus Omnitrophota bacterium]|nr:efflux RND transporter periplasmic adaptor subunit [Candidatus Omnitrophota bacterium]
MPEQGGNLSPQGNPEPKPEESAKPGPNPVPGKKEKKVFFLLKFFRKKKDSSGTEKAPNQSPRGDSLAGTEAVAPPKMKKRFRFPFMKILIWIVVGGVGFAVWKEFFMSPKKDAELAKKEAAAEQEKQEEEILPIRVFKVGRFNYEDSLNVLGSIKGGVEFKLSFEIPGVINSINYREGERYEEGALLISLRQDDVLIRLKRAQAEKNKAETTQALAQEKYKEHEKLFKIGAIPKTTLDRVKLEVDSAQYDSEAAGLEVKLNEAMLEKSNLYAPSDGMIGQLYVEEGEAITPNTMIGSHVATDMVFAEFGVVEREVGKLQLGQKARVYIDAYPDKTFEGVVENISPVVTGTSRTATGRVRLENPEAMLLPGMFARIKILLYSKRNALVVPTDAVQGGEDETFVFVANPRDNTVSKRNIKIGYKRSDYSQVDAGLEEGELVCVSGLEKLSE